MIICHHGQRAAEYRHSERVEARAVQLQLRVQEPAEEAESSVEDPEVKHVILIIYITKHQLHTHAANKRLQMNDYEFM